MAQLVTGPVLQTRARRRAPANDLIDAFRRQRLTTPRLLQHDEQSIRRRVRAVRRGDSHPRRRRTGPPSAPPADDHPCLPRRTRGVHRPADPRAATRAPRSGATHPAPSPRSTPGLDACAARPTAGPPLPARGSSATCAAPAPTAPSANASTRPAARRQATRHRIRAQRRVTTSDHIRVEPRHRRQPPRDRPRRQPRLAIAQADHRAVAALMSQELEHIRRRHLDRILADHREERLQIERHRPQRVRPRPTRDELQITIHQRITQLETGITTSSQRTNQTRRKAHPPRLPAHPDRVADVRKITRVLGDLLGRQGAPERGREWVRTASRTCRYTAQEGVSVWSRGCPASRALLAGTAEARSETDLAGSKIGAKRKIQRAHIDRFPYGAPVGPPARYPAGPPAAESNKYVQNSDGVSTGVASGGASPIAETLERSVDAVVHPQRSSQEPPRPPLDRRPGARRGASPVRRCVGAGGCT